MNKQSCKKHFFKVEADVFLGSVYDKTSVIIGNIPHKAAYREWATENMYEWREEIKVTLIYNLVGVVNDIISGKLS